MIGTLPTSYYDSLTGLSHFYVSAVCAGVRRSATTLIYQIMQSVFPEGGVVKTHSYLDVPHDTPVILTVRDLRDCAVSWWRITADDDARRNAEEVAAKAYPCGAYRLAALRGWVQPEPTFTVADAIRTAGIIKHDVFLLQQFRKRHNCLLLRYENFFSSLESLAQPLSEITQREIKPEVVAKYRLQANWGLRRFVDVPVPNWNADAATGPIQGGHCHDGKIGSWRDFCVEEVGAVLTESLSDELLELGYTL